jgi:hypothetical protein
LNVGQFWHVDSRIRDGPLKMTSDQKTPAPLLGNMGMFDRNMIFNYFFGALDAVI